MSEQEKRRSSLFVLAILMIVFIILVCVYYLIGYLAAQSEEKENENTNPELIDADLGGVDTFSYDVDGARQTFLQSDGEWIYVEDEALTLDQDSVKSMLTSLEGLRSEQVVADTLATSSEYGLGDPSMTITLTFTDGTQKILYIGEQNPMTDVYYASMEGDDHIYTISSEVPKAFLPVSELKEEQEENDGGDAEADASGTSGSSDGADDSDDSDAAAAGADNSADASGTSGSSDGSDGADAGSSGDGSAAAAA